jgi:hypothetical protein
MRATRGLSALFLVFAAAGCTWLRPPSLAECDKKQGMDQVDVCYSEAGINRLELKWCARVAKADLQAKCYAEVGEGLLREDLCVKAQATEPKEGCLARIASATTSIAVCARIATVAKRDDCIAEVATSTDDFELCARISIVSKRESCQATLARARQGETRCARIASVENRDTCFASLFGTSEAFDTICERISTPSIKQGCILKAAFEEPSRCDGLQDEARTRCYKDALWDVKAPAQCSRISDPAQQDKCRATLGGTRREELLCEQVKDASLRDDCLLKVASTDDPDVCFRIRAEDKSRRCAQATLATASDKRICTLLAPERRKECLAKMP